MALRGVAVVFVLICTCGLISAPGVLGAASHEDVYGHATKSVIAEGLLRRQGHPQSGQPAAPATLAGTPPGVRTATQRKPSQQEIQQAVRALGVRKLQQHHQPQATQAAPAESTTSDDWTTPTTSVETTAAADLVIPPITPPNEITATTPPGPTAVKEPVPETTHALSVPILPRHVEAWPSPTPESEAVSAAGVNVTVAADTVEVLRGTSAAAAPAAAVDPATSAQWGLIASWGVNVLKSILDTPTDDVWVCGLPNNGVFSDLAKPTFKCRRMNAAHVARHKLRDVVGVQGLGGSPALPGAGTIPTGIAVNIRVNITTQSVHFEGSPPSATWTPTPGGNFTSQPLLCLVPGRTPRGEAKKICTPGGGRGAR